MAHAVPYHQHQVPWYTGLLPCLHILSAGMLLCGRHVLLWAIVLAKTVNNISKTGEHLLHFLLQFLFLDSSHVCIVM